MPPPPDARPLRLLISFSPEDHELKDRLVRHLQVLVRFAGIELWSADRIRAGADWRQEIDHALEQADVALLLISADFLASDFLQDVEVPKLFERRERGGLRVIPVQLRSCHWEAVPWLEKLAILPKGGRAVASFEGDARDAALVAVAKEIVSLLLPASGAGGGVLAATTSLDEHRQESHGAPPRVSIVGAPSDDLYRANLEAQLKELADHGIVRLDPSGVNNAVEPGTASIQIHLLSKEHIDAIAPNKIDEMLVRHYNRSVRLVPVVVRTCQWRLSGFANLVVFPRNNRPVAKWQRQNDAWAEVFMEVKSICQDPVAAREADVTPIFCSTIPRSDRAHHLGASVSLGLAQCLPASAP